MRVGSLLTILVPIWLSYMITKVNFSVKNLIVSQQEAEEPVVAIAPSTLNEPPSNLWAISTYYEERRL